MKLNFSVVPMAAVALTALFVLTACSGDAGSSSDSEGMTKVTVGLLPVGDVAPAYIAEDQGYFAEEGIEVTFEVAQGGAAVIPAVISGNYDFGFSNLTSQMVAASQGLPIKTIAPGIFSTGIVGKDSTATVVAPDSDITSPADLSGRSVATNTLKNNFVMTASYIVQNDGGDPTQIEWTEIPWPDMTAALLNGNVDAVTLVEPFLSAAIAQGAKPVLWNWADTDPDFLVAGYFTTAQYLEQNPEIVEGFTRAINKARSFADANPDETRRIIGTFTEMDDATLNAITLPRFGGELDEAHLEFQAELAEEFGVTEKPLDIRVMLP